MLKVMHLLVVLTMCLIPSLASTAWNPFSTEDWESGRIDLGNKGDSMFYIMFKSRDHNASAPVILYMAGGPGTSGEYNLLMENGPFVATDAGKVVHNVYAWNSHCDLIYVDQPVGVGFSQARDNSTFCRSRQCVVNNMYVFMSKLYERRPELWNKPLFLAGVSYAGHYVPAVGAYIVRKADPRIIAAASSEERSSAAHSWTPRPTSSWTRTISIRREGSD